MSDATAQVWKDRYEIERPLGRGGMSAVYLAKDRQLLSKRVVVKVLLDDMSEDPWVRQKFFQEMEALARIDHPGVVGVLDTGQTPDGKQFLVMQYVEGQMLRSAIPADGMPIDQAAALIRQIAQALGAAHDSGVWHRDLKPENIMLQRSGGEDYAKLIDFGIAGIQNSQFTGEKTKVAGSLSYMAPEQFAGNPCAASDIYALAVVAYEMLTGKAPFGSSSMTHLVTEDLTVVLPRNARPEIPAPAERAILKGMAFRAEDRQASVREFGEQVYAALCNITEPTRRTVEEPTRRTAGREGSLEMAHVLFTDLVGYSRLPMDRQKQYLSELQAVVKASPRFRAAERAEDLISLPTGDGMALVFFGDPSSAAQCALEVAAALKDKPHLQLRMGIHTGPVYRVADVNANANVAGGGINIAQRVMDCGDGGHILVSKTVADVLMQLSDWGPCLCDLGEHAVKHGEKVHLYNLATADAGNAARPSKLAPAVVKAPAGEAPKKSKTGLVSVVVAAVVVAGAVEGWMLMHPKTQPTAPIEKARPLELSYQRMGDAKTIWFQVAPSEAGFLYFLNYGKEDDGSWTYRLAFPLNGGTAARPAGESLRVPTGNGVLRPSTLDETPYFVWSRKPINEMEELKGLPQDHGVAVVSGGKVTEVTAFLKKYEAPNDEILVRKISLEKQ
jgi:serine/threonine protein kinase